MTTQTKQLTFMEETLENEYGYLRDLSELIAKNHIMPLHYEVLQFIENLEKQ